MTTWWRERTVVAKRSQASWNDSATVSEQRDRLETVEKVVEQD
jgi:hypothetical protein